MIFGPLASPTTVAVTEVPCQLVGRGEDRVAVDDQHGREADLVALGGVEQVDLHMLAFDDALLASSGCDHCVHSEERAYRPGTTATIRTARAADHSIRAWSTITPRPSQFGHVSAKSVSRPSPMRLRVISTRPSSEMSKTCVRVLSRASASRNASTTLLAVVPDLHVDEVDDDDAADVAQPQLLGDLLGRLQVVVEDRLLEVRRADVLAGVDVDHRQRLGVLDDQRPTRRQPDLAVERLVELLVDVVALEERQALGLRVVVLDAVGQLRVEGADVVAHLVEQVGGRR